MKITMLGNSGSGKTSYLSVIGDLFYHSSVDGFFLSDRAYESNTGFAFRSFDSIGTLSLGEFPDGTFGNTVIPVTLKHDGKEIIDIDLIDYRGGAIDSIAKHEHVQGDDLEVEAILLGSDAILVFVDAAMLIKCERNLAMARRELGVDAITELLSRVLRHTKRINLIFLLTKCDSSTIVPDKDFERLVSLIPDLYNRFHSEARRKNFPVIPVGTVGINNVNTVCSEKKNTGSKISISFSQDIIDPFAMNAFGVKESFALALLNCIKIYSNETEDEIRENSARLNELRNMSGLENVCDLIFNNSSKRKERFNIDRFIRDKKMELERLEPYQLLLGKIASENCSKVEV